MHHIVPVSGHEVFTNGEQLGTTREYDLGEQFADRVCGSAPFAVTGSVHMVQFTAARAFSPRVG
ncbi:hypothetical protein GCM10009582_13430 [Arthrobacter flavus]